MPPSAHCFRQGDDEIAHVYCSPNHISVTAGPAIAVPGARVKVYSTGPKPTGDVCEGTEGDIKSLRRLQMLPLSKAAERVVSALLAGAIAGDLPKGLAVNRKQKGLWCTRCRVAVKVADVLKHRHVARSAIERAGARAGTSPA